MASRKVIEQRRLQRKLGLTSNYAKKHEASLQGQFTNNSPLRVESTGEGIELSDFNSIGREGL